MCVPAWIESIKNIRITILELIGINTSISKKQELSSSGSLAGGISPDSIHVSKKIAIDLEENQDAINLTVVSDTVPTEHGMRGQDLT